MFACCSIFPGLVAGFEMLCILLNHSCPVRARRMKYYRGCESKKTLKKRESGKKNNEHCMSDGVNHSAKGQSELSGETRNSD